MCCYDDQNYYLPATHAINSISCSISFQLQIRELHSSTIPVVQLVLRYVFCPVQCILLWLNGVVVVICIWYARLSFCDPLQLIR